MVANSMYRCWTWWSIQTNRLVPATVYTRIQVRGLTKVTYLNILAATSAAAIVALLGTTDVSAQSSKSTADYELVGDYQLGAPNFWDYLTYDPGSHRVFASHIDRIEVVDANTGKSVGQVKPFHDAHGVAIAADLGK